MKNIAFIFVLLLLVGLLTPLLSVSAEESLVAYWSFDEGNGDTASDSSDNGHDGMLMGDPQWTDGKFGGALEFDQAGDEVFVPYHANLNQEETFTVCAWANVAVGSSGHRAVVSCRDDFPQRGYILYAEPPPGNTWLFIVGIGGGWDHIRGPVVKLGEWEHVTGVYADDTMKFYVNGELVGEKNAKISVNPGQEFLIGAGANERANHQYLFKGKIDEVMVYDRELNKDEIDQVMELGGAGFLSVEPTDKLALTWGQLKAEW